MHINISKKILFAAILFAAICAAIFFLAVFPLLAEIEKYGANIQEQRDKIVGYGDRVAVAREFDTFAKEEKSNLDKVSAVFVNAEMPLELIGSLEAAARDSGIEIKLSQSALSQKNGGEWPSIAIGADVSGDINGVLRFMKKIESSPYLVETQSANIDIEEVKKKAVPVKGDASTSTKEVIQATKAEPEVLLSAQAHLLLKAYAK